MNMKRFFTLIITLSTLIVNVHAQSLSVKNVEVQTGEDTELVVSLAEGTSMTALQFNLSLPEGVSLKDNSDTYGAILGTATNGHALSVQPLASGDLLFILYNMEQRAFRNGELLRIPLKAGSAATDAKGRIYMVRTATASAVSHTCTDVSFSAKVKAPKQSVTIIADDLTMVYGDNVPTLTYKTEGTALNGTPKLTTTATKTSAVGTYPITVEKGTVTNTLATYKNGTLTIEKAPLTITAKSYTIKQGEELPALEVSYEGFKNGETEDVLTRKPSLICAATSASAPGTYNITVSGARSQNYVHTYVRGTLTIEKKDEPEPEPEPEPTTRSPFKGEISLPGTIEAENFDKGGEGITFHDSDPENMGGAEYRSDNDIAVDIEECNGGYAVSWLSSGEWIEYTVNVTKAGKYTYEAFVSSGLDNPGGFRISLVGKDGSFTKLADVSVPSTGDWATYKPVTGDLLQGLEVGSQILRITLTGSSTIGDCNIDKIKFDLKAEEPEPEPEPEPAYKVGDDITSLATAEWEGKTGDYGGLENPAVERYTHAAPEDVDDILTQTVTGLRNGTYKVQLDVAASFTPDRGFTCPTGDGLSVAFANGTQENLPVVERGWVGEGEQNIVTLTTTVTDGTLKYGIKNLVPSGNWFVARIRSIVYVSESELLPDAIEDVIVEDGTCQIYTLDGKQVETLQKGVNIIKYMSGMVKKVVLK